MLNLCSNQLIRLTCHQQLKYRAISASSVWRQNAAVHNIEKSNSEQEAKLTEDIKAGKIKISTKLRKKQPQRKPLVKNFFLANVDKELLAYPEAIKKDDLHNLISVRTGAEKYFAEFLDGDAIENTKTISTEVVENLKDLQCFGMNISQIYGGRELFTTESAVTSEVETDVNIAQMLNNHRLVTQILSDYGTDEARRKYLPKLASGEMIGTVAIFEKQPTETGSFNTTAQIRTDEKVWLLNGEKSFVVNGNSASLYLVFANTNTEDKLGDITLGVSIFLVESNAPNVIQLSPEVTLGCRGITQTTIQFQNAEIPCENIIGELNQGSEIGHVLLRHSRLQTSIIAANQMKGILKDLTEFAIDSKTSEIALWDMELTKERIAKMTGLIYAVESMSYMTAGLMDGYENQDVDVEAAITKTFALENLPSIASWAAVMKGPAALLDGERSERYLRDATQLLIQGETVDSMKLFIGFSGLQHAGLNINDTVKKVRNPLMFPAFIFGRIFDRRNMDEPKLILKLHENLHPSLDPAANWLEQSVFRLQMATEILLTRHGHEIMTKQIEVIRLAECAILTYAMFAAISRASRAYCIGLKFADYEMLTASTFALDAKDRIQLLAMDIAKGPFITNDANLLKLSKQVLKSRGYFLEHPTTLNF